MNDKYELVREQLLKYKEYKQRKKIIEHDRLDIIQGDIAYKYEHGAGAKTNNISSQVENKVLDLLQDEEDLRQEYIDKLKFVAKVELALDGLGPAERFIIERKFCLVNLRGEYVYQSGTVRDIDIYQLEEFPHGHEEYKEIKSRAINRLARLLK